MEGIQVPKPVYGGKPAIDEKYPLGILFEQEINFYYVEDIVYVVVISQKQDGPPPIKIGFDAQTDDTTHTA